MITLSQINGSLSVYRDNQVILWGGEEQILPSLTLLLEHGIHPVAVCSPESSHWGKQFHFLPVLSPDEVANTSEPTVLQLTTPDPDQEYLLIEERAPLFFTPALTLIRHGELHAMLPFFADLDANKHTPPDSLQRDMILRHRALSEQQKALAFFHSQEKEALFLCMPPKTGDHTLIDTFTKHHIPHHFVFHNPDFWDPSLFLKQGKKVKIITAVRKPRAQELSLMYQMLGDLSRSITARFLMYGRYDRDFFREGGDVEEFFSLLCHSFAQGDPFQSGEQSQFYQRLEKNILPLPSFPIEQGYGVYSLGELELFVYQLEKLDHIVPQLASFVGGQFQTLEKGNEANKKWIASSYQEAKKSLTLPPDVQYPDYQTAWHRKFYGEPPFSPQNFCL